MSVSALSSSSSSYWEKMLAQMKGSSGTQSQDDLSGKLFGDLDSDGDGLLSLGETGLSSELYNKIDADGDGSISQTELQQAIETQRNAMFTNMQMGQSQDASQTTSTTPPSAQDLLSAIMSGQVPGSMQGAGPGGKGDDLASKLFSSLDTDSSDGLSLDESGLSQSVYDAMDTNQDGSVSADELAIALEKQRSAMGMSMNSASRSDTAFSFLSALANNAYLSASQTTAAAQGLEALA